MECLCPEACSTHCPALYCRGVDALRAFAKNWMPLLFNAFSGSEPGRRGSLAQTIGAYARICDQAFLTGLFHTVLKKLLKVSSLLSALARLAPLAVHSLEMPVAGSHVAPRLPTCSASSSRF